MTGLVSETLSQAIAATIGHESAQVQNLRAYNEAARDLDPSKLAWPATLPIELALRQFTPGELRVAYGYSEEEWDALRLNPVFLKELAGACELMSQEGMSFKAKVRFQAEAMLETNWRLVHAPTSEVPAASKVKLMEATWRMAGFDNKDGGGGSGNHLNIQINLGG